MLETKHVPPEVIAAIKDPNSPVVPRFELTIDGRSYSKRVDALGYGWGEGGSAILLTARLSGRLPASMQGDEVALNITIGNFTHEAFVSRWMRFELPDGEFVTNLTAATAGALADDVKLEADFSTAGWSPHAILHNAVRRLPYAPHQIRLAQVETPLIDRSEPTMNDPEDTAFKEGETVQDMIDVVHRETITHYFDTARGFRFEIDPGLGEGIVPTWSYTRNTAEVFSWPSPVRLDPEEEYSKVVVLDKEENGDDRVRVVREITFRGIKNPPVAGRVLYLPFSDKSAGFLDRAKALAAKEVKRIRKGLCKGTASVAYNPFLYPKRVVTYDEEYRDDAGLWHRQWLCVLGEDVTHTRTARGARTTDFSYTATKAVETLREESVDKSRVALAGRGVAYATGVDNWGIFVFPEHATPGSGWVAYDARGLVFNPENAPGLFASDARGYYLKT